MSSEFCQTLFDQRWQSTLDDLKETHRYRSLPIASPVATTEGDWLQTTDEQRLINLSSNDYLGLRHHPVLVQAAQEALATYGVGMGSSRYIGGNSYLYERLETAVAHWKRTEAALVFPTGFQTNLTALPALCGAGDVIVMDKLNHASLVDGSKLSGAKVLRYRHLDLADAERRLQQAAAYRSPHGQVWLVSDSLFSMEGNFPDLHAWVALANQYGAATYLDEAHACGVFGATRASGLAEQMGCSHRITVHMGTFSKALGGLGGYLAGNKLMIEFLKNKARGVIYTTALPPAVLASNATAVTLIQTPASAEAIQPVQRLWQHIHTLRKMLPPEVLPVQASPILPLYVGDAGRALQLANECRERFGVQLTAVRPPTVPQGRAMLRLSVSAGLSDEQVSQTQACLSFLQPSLIR
ncbi:MAG: aminotransferase class I/II-fold pyridoxal phosphate-dependent enzyme [Vampirovibrionales bacterium]